MEHFTSKDFIYIIGIIVAAVTTFFSTRYNIKSEIRDKGDDLMKEIVHLRLEMKDLKNRDDLQQQVIDQMSKQNEDLIPKLLNLLNTKNNGRK